MTPLELMIEDIRLMREYLLVKFREEDYHGVADAAMDLREMVVARSYLEKSANNNLNNGANGNGPQTL
jgi:uncharacterized membrane protein YgcG